MRCKEAERLMSRYVDDELGASERDALKRHLAVCAVCAALHDEMGRIRQRLRAAAAAIPETRVDQASYWAEIEPRLGAAPQGTLLVNVPWRVAAPVIGAAAALLVATLLWTAPGGDGGPSPQSPYVTASGSAAAETDADDAEQPARSGSSERTVPHETHSGLDAFPASPGALWEMPTEQAEQPAEVLWF